MGDTRFIEVDMYHGDMAWECEECKAVWVYSDGTPNECNVNYCPNCGRKITEYVEYVEEDDGY